MGWITSKNGVGQGHYACDSVGGVVVAVCTLSWL